MAPNSYFNDYVDILSEALKRIRKVGLKKYSSLKQFVDMTESFLSKEVYGRIQPSHYLLCLILLLGSRNPKIYPVAIQAIQKLFSHNFISHNESVSQSLRLLKEEHREFLLLPYEDYEKKIFKEVYIETLSMLPERDDGLNLLIIKNFSLIWRLSQSSLGGVAIGKIFEFILESIIENKVEENTQTLKSTFLEIVRHSFESYKECLDYKLITDENDISVKSLCHNYGRVLADQVAIQSAVREQHGVESYSVLPPEESGAGQSIKEFKLLPSEEVNENGEPSGKFGWCISCRRAANYYCIANRVPVCSFDCKNRSLHEFQMVDKLVSDEARSARIFENHLKRICRLFVKYLGGTDAKKTTCFSEIFVFVSTELKKWNFAKVSENTLRELRWVFRQTIFNVQVEHDAFVGSILSMKKMLALRTFVEETEILLRLLARKLTHFLTTAKTKEEVLKLCKELIASNLLFDYAFIFDCRDDHSDLVKALLHSLSLIYRGLEPPEGILLPPEDALIRKTVYELMNLLFQQIVRATSANRMMPEIEETPLFEQKKVKNLLFSNIQRFNKTEKPFKVVKALIKENYLAKDPQAIAQFLYKNLPRLNSSNIGVLIGGYDELQNKIRFEYFKKINFEGLSIDDAMRKLLKYFTMPGESQVVDRIIDSFSQIFYSENKDHGDFSSSDAVYSFSYLLMMLQTNLHNPQVLEKMTLEQYSNLSKGMNGEVDFDKEFLAAVYHSIQKTQLGFHEKANEMEIIFAYKESPKKASELHQKELKKEINSAYEGLKLIKYDSIPSNIAYPIRIYCQQFLPSVLEVLSWRVRELEAKEEVLKEVEKMEEVLKFSVEHGATEIVSAGVKHIWEELSRVNTVKKYVLMEKLLDWVELFDGFLLEQWSVVVRLLSTFNRNRLFRKEYPSGSRKEDREKTVLAGDKLYIYEPFVASLWARSSKYAVGNFRCLIEALIESSRQEIEGGAHPFCLEKIGEVQEQNMGRALEVFPLLWPLLRDYYVELGRNKSEKTALFGTDFLKQLITKFLKKKDLLAHQREYMRPLEDIFADSKLFAVKEYIIGSLSYFINNHHANLRAGWKVILPILCEAFDEDQDPVIKEKAFASVRKLYETGFSTLNLEDNYIDFVQLLSRLAHEKDEQYPKGCILAIQSIVDYYHSKYRIGEQLERDQKGLEKAEDAPLASLDVTFWQTYFLPLLSTIYGICGDARSDVQLMSIELLFGILMKYGRLFKYEFWKMVLQGVLRPTFEEITYASQSKSSKKEELESWLRNSFELLFSSINSLIQKYFQDFRLFLSDVLKIYESCILSYSNKILIQLSVSALGDLFSRVGSHFEASEWEEFLRFSQNVLKKTIPHEVYSEESWEKQRSNPEKTFEGKFVAMRLFFVKLQEIIEKYHFSLGEYIIEEIVLQLKTLKISVDSFNKDIALRKKLWEEGFFSDLKILPGLVKQQHELLKAISTGQFHLSKIDEAKYLSDYLTDTCVLIQEYSQALIFKQEKEKSIEQQERHREGAMLQILLSHILESELPNISVASINKVQFNEKLFDALLNVSSRRSFCSDCEFCEDCQTSFQRETTFSETVKSTIKRLYLQK